MDKVWSNSLLGIESLDIVRNLRFHKNNAKNYLNVLPIKNNQNILDIGCGSGSLTRCLYDWFKGNLLITGIDFDEEYIEYCKNMAIKNNYNIQYKLGDACSLDFPESFFDITISSSVLEHVENKPFLTEQFRVLKQGGYIIVMNVSGYKEDLGLMEGIYPITEEENEIKKELGEYMNLNVRKPSNRFLLHKKPKHSWLKMMEEYGFKNISHQIVKACNSVDNAQDEQFQELIINNFFANDMDLVWAIENNCDKIDLIQKAGRLKTLLNERKQNRLEVLKQNKKLWDYIETDTNILIGQKPN
jgi:ubiquinone/menaquinone biosynthesis C-methylase UbiE